MLVGNNANNGGGGIGGGGDPWVDATANMTPAQQREQRQRSIRFILMFLLMLTLMDGEEVQRQQQNRDAQLRQRKPKQPPGMETNVYEARRRQDNNIQSLLSSHPRYQHLLTRNENIDYDRDVREWALQRSELQRDEFGPNQPKVDEPDPMEEKVVFHYPWNTSGYYRGEWRLKNVSTFGSASFNNTQKQEQRQKKDSDFVQPRLLEAQLGQFSLNTDASMGVVLLPDGLHFDVPNSTRHAKRRSNYTTPPTFLRGAVEDKVQEPFHIPLSKSSGRVAFQLYARSVPAIHEISIIEGFVKLFDSNSVGYSSKRDVLLRVYGVVIHSLGKISLTSSPSIDRSALVIPSTHRRLQEVLKTGNVEDIRQEALALYHSQEIDTGKRDYYSTISSVDTSHRKLDEGSVNFTTGHNHTMTSDYIFPYPYVFDDSQHSIANKTTPSARPLPLREQNFESNAGDCEFELSLNIQEEKWTIGKWRRLLLRRIKDLAKLNPVNTQAENKTLDTSKKKKKKVKKKALKDQALAMILNGTVISYNCNFAADINVTAIRTNWESTKSKAVNYSFYMMLICLTQIVLLLRQLLHTQAQSAASRVSLLCIGWQTVLDALLCLVHVYMSLAWQPLFSAFASVAFFKLLIFCVIELKYMALIIQARNVNSGENTLENLRRQIAMLHLRFYVSLLGVFILFFYVWENYQTIYILLLYSFWVPQIVYNIITEAKQPLHRYYIHGMSASRLVAPIYAFALKSNFLKEVNPDATTNLFLCELLVVWVAIQAAILEAQSRYGTRFMIPTRFLPPKFDYNRPIPESLLPSPVEEDSPPSVALQKERGGPEMSAPLVAREAASSRRGARNRMKGTRTTEAAPMTTETINESQVRTAAPSFECVICYNEIDIRNRTGYMLAPCDHVFHKDCLVQWMEVKMECPICRKTLPTL